MKQYLELVKNILELGAWQENRTGIRTISLPGAMMRFDLQKGFPAVTTKKLAFKSAIGEMLGFLRASRNAEEFRQLGCKVWDANANQNQEWLANPYRQGEDDLGEVYGVQWREWKAYKVLSKKDSRQISDAIARGYQVLTEWSEQGEQKVLLYQAYDQLENCLQMIIHQPQSRRILFHGWNPAALDQIALPACHLLYQFLPNPATAELSLCLYLRSNDIGLGAPFNLTEGAALLSLVARLTGYTPRWFTYFIGDAHIYENHLPMLKEQLTRDPLPSPTLQINERIPEYLKTQEYAPEWLKLAQPSDFTLENYQHHAPLTAPMAV